MNITDDEIMKERDAVLKRFNSGWERQKRWMEFLKTADMKLSFQQNLSLFELKEKGIE
jgi:hypothetical protein